MSATTTKGALDGGPFRCGLHDKEFVTTDPVKWSNHLSSDGDHSMSGQKPCTMCGSMHVFEDEPAGNAVFCDKCKPKLSKLFSGKEPSKAKK